MNRKWSSDMYLYVLGSSSAGNCYLLEADNEMLILEAGVNFMAVKKYLKFDLSRVKAVICTHIHGDHAAYIGDYKKAFIPTYLPTEAPTIHNAVNDGEVIEAGSFRITPYKVKHDVLCYSYLIEYKETRVLFITDTCCFPYTLPNIDAMLIEANYDEDILKRNVISGMSLTHATRVIESHMSINNAVNCCLRHKNDRLRNIVLLHLSAQNSDERSFIQKMQSRTGIATYVAHPIFALDIIKI